MVYCVSKQ